MIDLRDDHFERVSSRRVMESFSDFSLRIRLAERNEANKVMSALFRKRRNDSPLPDALDRVSEAIHGLRNDQGRDFRNEEIKDILLKLQAIDSICEKIDKDRSLLSSKDVREKLVSKLKEAENAIEQIRSNTPKIDKDDILNEISGIKL
jgi:uncharacterized membrane-anchored protein YjiN (DUF445 family)